MAKLIWNKPINLVVYSISTGWLFIFLLHLIEQRSTEPYAEFAADWIMIGAGVVFWPLFTTARLMEMGLNRTWILAFASPWIALVVTALRGPRLAALASLILLIASQSLLIFWGGFRPRSQRGQGQDLNP